MIYGVGTDIVEIRRIGAVQAKHPRFAARVCTSQEIEAYLAKGLPTLAGRFAAKEAVAKALGCGLGKIAFREIEIYQDPLGKPQVRCHGAAARLVAAQKLQLHVTISHSQEYATAVAIAETKEGSPCVC